MESLKLPLEISTVDPSEVKQWISVWKGVLKKKGIECFKKKKNPQKQFLGWDVNKTSNENGSEEGKKGKSEE